MNKMKKIYRKCSDFYSAMDLFEPNTNSKINLTIKDFDEKGQVAHPRAPCVVPTIDPHYIVDAKRRNNFRKFRVKSDILQLREITRKKFMLYATQERALDKSREKEYNTKVYNRLMDFFVFAQNELNNIEQLSFADMMAKNEELKQFQSTRLADELKNCVDDHQHALMEVQQIYRRFRFLLKLISYFDIINFGANDAGPKLEITNVNLVEDQEIGKSHIEHLEQYMSDVIRPYLAKHNHLNVELWKTGYENIRRKIFNYNRQFTQVAILNHILKIIYEKFLKTHTARTSKLLYHKDAKCLTMRIASLKSRAMKIMNDFESDQKADKISSKILGIIPVVLDKVVQLQNDKQGDDSEKVQQEKLSKKQATSIILRKVEKIQVRLLNLLSEFDRKSPTLCRNIEANVRAKLEEEMVISRRALIKENRYSNWIEHYKKH